MEELVDYYKELELNDNCTPQEIKTNFKKLVLKYHPDKQKTNSNDKFNKIEIAYRTLIDKNTRRKYDAELNLMKNNLQIINEEVYFQNLIQDHISKDYLYYCWCGGIYKLNVTKFEDIKLKFSRKLIKSFILTCNSCSLNIKLIDSII